MGVKLAAASGGSVELVPTNTASNYTITLPASTSTVLTTTTAGIAISGPAFRAYKSAAAQTVTNTTNTKMVLDVEAFDTASCFNNTASTVGGIPAYAFLPNVAGYYQFNGTAYSTATSALNYNFVQFYKNGAQDSAAIYGPYNTTSQIGSNSALIYLNGTTDYVEFYVQISGTGTLAVQNSSSFTYFNGFLARAA